MTVEGEPGHFGDRLINRIRNLENPLCVGLDPFLDKIPSLFRHGSMTPHDERTVPAVCAFLSAVLERIGDKVAIVKPQAALFERLGWRGMQLLDKVIRQASNLGLLVLMDAKRGDIGSTATAYAGAFLTEDAPFRSDALTISPFLGRDTLTPYLDAARETGAGVFVLVKTSNPGSGDYQDLAVGNRTLSETIAHSLKDLAQAHVGPETGWSSLGVVVGATYPKQADELRKILPKSIFLIPGYGAQGGDADDAFRAFVAGPRGLEGGIINSSRGILFPKNCETTDAASWEASFDSGLTATIDSLAEARERHR